MMQAQAYLSIGSTQHTYAEVGIKQSTSDIQNKKKNTHTEFYPLDQIKRFSVSLFRARSRKIDMYANDTRCDTL